MDVPRGDGWFKRFKPAKRIAVLLCLAGISSIPLLALGQDCPDQLSETANGTKSGKPSAASFVKDIGVPLVNQSPAGAGAASCSAGGEGSHLATPSATESPAKDVPATKKERKKKEKRGAIVAAPLPISSPALGTGIIPVVAYIFAMNKDDKITPPSLVGGAGLITDNGSRVLALGGDLYLQRGAYEVRTAFLDGHLNYNFYGTGEIAGNAGRKLAVVQTGRVYFGEGLRRLGWKFYLGPRIWFGHSEIVPDLGKSDSDHPDIPPTYLQTVVRAFGFRLQRDSRPNRFYPTSGTLIDLTSNFFYITSDSGVGSGTGNGSASSPGGKSSFQTYRLTLNKYASLSQNQVLAYNLDLCAANGQAPYYGQCIFGTDNELRGYVAGRYIDRRMFATQLEYRLALPRRFGATAFGGVGEVAPTTGAFSYSDLLPAVGAGLRYKLSTKYHVNLRLDIAQGRNGHTWSMGVGEAF